jgi:tripartite-type tricarboxylate transporter receptor subunit TctC
MVVPYAAGGATDVIARALAERLTAQWGQQVFVENRAGAGTTLAAALVSRATGDGYTLFMTTSAHTIAGSMYKNLPYDPVKDFAPLSLLAKVPLVLVTRPGLGPGNLREFTELAKTGKLTYASPGNGTAQHLTGEMFKVATGTKMSHVPYKGDAPAVTDLLGGVVDCMFVTLTAVLPQIAAGKLTPIAIANGKRIEKVADIPTFAEAGMANFEAATWFGVLAPSTLRPALRDSISQDIVRIVAQPAMRARLIDLGGEVVSLNATEFDTFMRAELRKWKEIAATSGATLD